MNKTLLLLLSMATISTSIFSQEDDNSSENKFETVFEKSKGLKTATYEQTILFYEELAKYSPDISIKKIGETDSGMPLHLVLFDVKQLDGIVNTKKITVLINNGIHPGESDGIDASMMLLRDIAQSETLKATYKNVKIGIIPIYNVGGSLNRNRNSRANQNGPRSYGFRGNALNYDLNRDFIKSETKNAAAFAQIFHSLNPDLFIDTHVSNGADYQYTLTHLFTQHNKLGGKLGNFLNHLMIPEIEADLNEKNRIITPFVNVYNELPENGFSQFLDTPRYSTGYTTLFNTLGLMIETHMLKPYKQRVEATYDLLFSLLDFADNNIDVIKLLREHAVDEILSGNTYPIQWEIDSTSYRTIDFKGYEGEYFTSEVTGHERLKYDRSRPFTKPVKYYNHFKPTVEVTVPKYYVIPKVLKEIIKRLRLNNIEIHPLKSDIGIEVESYKIDDYKTSNEPFEGHYLHRNTTVLKSNKYKNFKKGDFLVPTDQPGVKYLLETLEPAAADSFFNWNFFDVILQQKEHFSPYVFEDLAVQILERNSELKEKFDLKKENDPEFAYDPFLQLEYIYKNSRYAEKSYLQYPIYRILK